MHNEFKTHKNYDSFSCSQLLLYSSSVVKNIIVQLERYISYLELVPPPVHEHMPTDI